MKLIRVLAVDDDPDFQYLLEQTVGSQIWNLSQSAQMDLKPSRLCSAIARISS